jgi:hypothetical protein
MVSVNLQTSEVKGMLFLNDALFASLKGLRISAGGTESSKLLLAQHFYLPFFIKF